MKKTFMITFELPQTIDETFMALIPQQRYIINNMLVEGKLKSYSLSMDRSQLWAVAIADSEFDVMELIAQMPLIDYMTPQITELMFHNSAERVLQFSLN
jgi:muconolactone delta-isomerase